MGHKSIAPTRVTIQAKQRVARYSRTRTQPVPADYIPQEVLDSTFVLKPAQADKGPVQLRRAVRAFTVGAVHILEGSPFYFVRSKFGSNRFYVVVEDARESERDPHTFSCSSTEERTVKMLIQAVLATRRMTDYNAA